VASAPQPAEAQARPNEAARLQDPTRGCTLAVMNSGFTYRERIGPEAAGESVLAYLTRRYRHTAEADWRGRIASGEVVLEEAPAEPEAVLRRGQSLVWRRPPWQEPTVPLAFAVIHRDPWLMAVAKPRAHLVVW